MPRMYDLSKDLKNGKAAHLWFFLNYFETVIGGSGCKFENVHSWNSLNSCWNKWYMNDKSQSNIENLLSNMKYIVDKCRKFGMKKILKSGLVYTTRVSLEVLDKI